MSGKMKRGLVTMIVIWSCVIALLQLSKGLSPAGRHLLGVMMYCLAGSLVITQVVLWLKGRRERKSP